MGRRLKCRECSKVRICVTHVVFVYCSVHFSFIAVQGLISRLLPNLFK